MLIRFKRQRIIAVAFGGVTLACAVAVILSSGSGTGATKHAAEAADVADSARNPPNNSPRPMVGHTIVESGENSGFQGLLLCLPTNHDSEPSVRGEKETA